MVIVKRKRVKIKTFVCEICHCVTPIHCEGSEPNTCADCMPIYDGDNEPKIKLY